MLTACCGETVPTLLEFGTNFRDELDGESISEIAAAEYFTESARNILIQHRSEDAVHEFDH